MEAKELVIANLYKQRRFIENGLKKIKSSSNEDGDPTFIYVGHLFKENEVYFKGKGFDINLIYNDQLTAAARGRDVYAFTPQYDIELTAEEAAHSQAIVEAKAEDGNDFDGDGTEAKNLRDAIISKISEEVPQHSKIAGVRVVEIHSPEELMSLIGKISQSNSDLRHGSAPEGTDNPEMPQDVVHFVDSDNNED
ncbi:MAG: hypothetical protein K6D97_01210 [Clostridia bacterium]|nr:hypothetical protein [Clostridia bacterium]